MDEALFLLLFAAAFVVPLLALIAYLNREDSQ